MTFRDGSAGGDGSLGDEASVPADFAAALAGNVRAREVFDAMPASHQQRWIWSVTSAKGEQTRQRRISKAIEELSSR
ncbi:MAG: YdeI/OmpD-associated family protein [Streptosporangiaceae bacterium]